MKIISVSKDGNCFFSCLQQCQFPQKSVQTLRKEIVDYYLKLQTYRKTFDISEEEVKDLYENGCWNNNACDHIVKIACKKYNLVISLYLPEWEKKLIVRPDYQNKKLRSRLKPPKTISLRLLHDHYDIVHEI